MGEKTVSHEQFGPVTPAPAKIMHPRATNLYEAFLTGHAQRPGEPFGYIRPVAGPYGINIC